MPPRPPVPPRAPVPGAAPARPQSTVGRIGPQWRLRRSGGAAARAGLRCSPETQRRVSVLRLSAATQCRDAPKASAGGPRGGPRTSDRGEPIASRLLFEPRPGSFPDTAEFRAERPAEARLERRGRGGPAAARCPQAEPAPPAPPSSTALRRRVAPRFAAPRDQRPRSTAAAGHPCGCSSMVERQPSKLNAWVRFPSPAPSDRRRPWAEPQDAASIPLLEPGRAGRYAASPPRSTRPRPSLALGSGRPDRRRQARPSSYSAQRTSGDAAVAQW